MEGFIGIYRKMMKWEWYQDHNTKAVFLHLLLLASHEGGNWQGQTIERGQLITGRKRLAHDLKLTERQIRTSLSKLKSTNEIAIKSTNKNSVITITSYDTYNPLNEKRTSKPTNGKSEDQPTSDQQTTTLKNVENEKKEKKDNSTDFSKDSDEIQFSKELYDRLKENNAKTKEPNWKQWAREFDLMFRIDGHTKHEIADVICWTAQDDFWKKNILSPVKLRMQFARLFGAMKDDKNWHGQSDNDGNQNNDSKYYNPSDPRTSHLKGLFTDKNGTTRNPDGSCYNPCAM